MVAVDVAGLREAADGYVRYGENFGNVAKTSIPNCSLPSSATPVVDFGFQSAYRAAYEAMDLATRTLSGTLGTIGLALTRVANHYENNEAANTRMFQGKPITAPRRPSPGGWTPTSAAARSTAPTSAGSERRR
ncbi:WXG100 family type VII secretion target [Dactylosporangium cerinum]|uniref:WXG100 family type VII secretion target n=1 Tax=Dactylosporangium cerinum TaxID=1434730 RepID=A0ABV9WFU5_9ACTN